jgi:hypothetical protein
MEGRRFCLTADPSSHAGGSKERGLSFGASCPANERSKSSNHDLDTLQLLNDVRRGRNTASATHRGRALPLQGLTLEIGLVLPAQHAVCLVHVALQFAVDSDAR